MWSGCTGTRYYGYFSIAQHGGRRKICGAYYRDESRQCDVRRCAKEVFRHYKELEAVGLAAPQVTYLMHELEGKGLNVDTDATTVAEARACLLEALTGIDSGKTDFHM